jgi:hypothetical protein
MRLKIWLLIVIGVALGRTGTCLPAHAAEDGEEARSSSMAYILIRIHGTASGGSISIGEMDTSNEPVTVETKAGETEPEIAAKLAATKGIPNLGLCKDGKTLKVWNTMYGNTYVRINDPGIEKLTSISNLRVTPSKADKKVHLAWTPPDPAPRHIFIYRGIFAGGDMVAKLDGTKTSFDDKGKDDYAIAVPVDNFFTAHKDRSRITYRIVCGYNPKPTDEVHASRYSDVVEVATNNPAYMKNDEYGITTNDVPFGKIGSDYRDYGNHPFLFEKNGGVDPCSWSIESGTLPKGLTLSTDGVLGGTPTDSGKFSFTVKAIDATGAATTQKLHLEVYEAEDHKHMR